MEGKEALYDTTDVSDFDEKVTEYVLSAISEAIQEGLANSQSMMDTLFEGIEAFSQGY